MCNFVFLFLLFSFPCVFFCLLSFQPNPSIPSSLPPILFYLLSSTLSSSGFFLLRFLFSLYHIIFVFFLFTCLFSFLTSPLLFFLPIHLPLSCFPRYMYPCIYIRHRRCSLTETSVYSQLLPSASALIRNQVNTSLRL